MRAVLLLVSVVLVLATAIGCGGGPAPPADAGRQVWEAKGCAGCHGDSGVVRTTAPPLTDLAQHWDRDSLAAYLADPAGVKARTPRLQYLNESYPVVMPKIQASPDELRLLADYLLGH